MAPEAELAEVIQLGRDLTSIKLYESSVTALLIYDYFLTFKDEIHYAWKTENTFIFVLFLLTRYIPVAFHVWVITAFMYPGYTPEMYLWNSFWRTLNLRDQPCRCKKTAFIGIAYYTFIGLIAQIVLAQRTYAIMMKNRWIAGILYMIIAIQFGCGVHESVWSALHPTVDLSPIPLDTYQICLTHGKEDFTMVQMSLSLLFDIVVFALVVVQTRIIKSSHNGMNLPTILDTISRDASIYFAVIATSHVLIIVMLLAARSPLRAIGIVGNSVFIPMMMSRMIISLKKAAQSGPPHTSIVLPTLSPTALSDTRSHHTADPIRLSVFKSRPVGTPKVEIW